MTDPLPPAGEPRRPAWRLHIAVAVVVVIAAAAAGAWWAHGQTARQPQIPNAFNLDTAMNLAGETVPTHIESFYFIVLERGAPDESAELAVLMAKAAGEHDFLGVTGADSEHNLAVLAAAIARLAQTRLSGLILIYIGPPGQEAKVTPMVQATGAELRFVPYDPSVPDPADMI